MKKCGVLAVLWLFSIIGPASGSESSWDAVEQDGWQLVFIGLPYKSSLGNKNWKNKVISSPILL